MKKLKTPPELDRITDRVLAYKVPARKPKQKKRQRKARKRRLDRDSGGEGHNSVWGA